MQRGTEASPHPKGMSFESTAKGFDEGMQDEKACPQDVRELTNGGQFTAQRPPATTSSSTTARVRDVKYGERREFVNHGLRRWEEGRAKWLRLGDPARSAGFRRRPPPVDEEVIYDCIFSKPIGWYLPHAVPLTTMVELLEDEWSD
mmetsp:Transcript_25863/g.83758  ORF Transcript_25863/g.83758 Transcript_25863/m.83758 type:complete len:146 (-) Transcript_25863:2353-2790(-)